MNVPVNRIPPKLPAHAMKTYSILAPVASHFRVGRCAEVECDAQARGWATRVDETTELGQKQAHYIRTRSGRYFTEGKSPSGLTEFTFPPGQECFRTHHVRLDREEIFVVRDGDFRGNPRGTEPRILTPSQFVDDFATHQQKLADRFERG